MKFLFFFFLQFLILHIESESITLYLALDSELKEIKADGEPISIKSYSKNELSDIYLIKKFSITIEKNLTIISSSNASLAALIIDNDSNDSNDIYLSSSLDGGHWREVCEGEVEEEVEGEVKGDLVFLTLVRDYIWNNNNKIPPLASVIQSQTGKFCFEF